MGFFGKSFEEKVEEAIAAVRAKGLPVRNLAAAIDGKTVTLSGEVDSADIKGQVMQAFNALVETDNTMNKISVKRPPEVAKVEMPQVGNVGGPESPESVTPEAGAPVAGGEKIHEVVSGDTLGKLAKKYYGNASKYMKIFEANTDQLDNPDLIKVGQKLRIPE